MQTTLKETIKMRTNPKKTHNGRARMQ